MRLAIMVMLTITIHAAAPGLSEACLGGREGDAGLSPGSTLLESALQGPIMLRAEGVRIVLRPPQDLARLAPGELLRRAVVSRRLILLLCDLRAAETPETLFSIYLNLLERADQASRASHLLAQFNFFSAVRPGDTTMPVWQSFDITHAVGTLAEQGVLDTEATLTILAARTFDPESRPNVGHIAIVQQ